MSRFVTTLMIMVAVLVGLGAVGPTLVRLVNALVPLVLVVGILAVVWQVTKYLTRQ